VFAFMPIITDLAHQPFAAILAARGIKYRTLARAVPCSEVWISRLASGKEKPSEKMRDRIAELLDVPADALFLDSDGDRVLLEFVARTTASSGVPTRLEDPAVAATVARTLQVR
jgi:transcriptional regulator with XRE-family HTH domain